MATNFATALRTAVVAAIVTQAGASAKLKFYSGTRPSGVTAVGGGTTLLGTVTLGAGGIGTTSSGAIDWDEASATQSNGSHVSGTPTFVDLTTSADTVLFRTDLGAGSWTFTGSIATGQNITLSSLVTTAGNA
jgi:hypothetical protein